MNLVESQDHETPEKFENSRQSLGKILSSMKVDQNDFNIVSLQSEAEKQVSFLRTLNNMTERVKVFAEYFNQKRPSFERVYIERKQREIQQNQTLANLAALKQPRPRKSRGALHANSSRVSRLSQAPKPEFKPNLDLRTLARAPKSPTDLSRKDLSITSNNSKRMAGARAPGFQSRDSSFNIEHSDATFVEKDIQINMAVPR